MVDGRPLLVLLLQFAPERRLRCQVPRAPPLEVLAGCEVLAAQVEVRVREHKSLRFEPFGELLEALLGPHRAVLRAFLARDRRLRQQARVRLSNPRQCERERAGDATAPARAHSDRPPASRPVPRA